MRALASALTVVLAATLAGCGKEAAVRPIVPNQGTGQARAMHTIVGGLPRTGVTPDLPNDVQGESDRAHLVHLKRIGHPIWRPVGFHMFSGPVGNAGNGYADFLTTILALLPPPNHQFHPQLGAGPGAPHAPPYDHELAMGVANLGFTERHSFNVPGFSNGKGVYVVWMNVPDPGTTGSSPDFASGPIIPNSLFPIHIAGIAFRNGQVWDPFLGTFDRPPLPDLTPPFNVDGDSHFPVFYFDNFDFAPPNTPPQGEYVYRIRMTDTSGNGWDIAAKFRVSRVKTQSRRVLD